MENTETVKKMDRRVVKTKRAIRNAFTKLLTVKNIDEITIKDIADEADVNRKTIYNYYNGIYEIQGEVENEIVDAFKYLIKDIEIKTYTDVARIFDDLNTIMNKDIDFYGHLLDINVNSLLVRKMTNVLRSILRETFIKNDLFPEDKVYVIVDYIGYGMLGAYQNWFSQGRKQPMEEFTHDISTLVFKGIEAYLK